MRKILSVFLATLILWSFSALASEVESVPNSSAVAPMHGESSDVKESKKPQFGLGFELQTSYVPEFFLHIALRGAHDTKGNGFGFRGIYRTKNVDVIAKFSYWKIDAPNGVWLGITGDWYEADYVEFVDFGLAYLEISATWNTKIAENIYFIYGGGIGGGVILGDIYTTPANGGCTADNFQNVSTNGTGCSYSTTDFRREKEDLPPGMGSLTGFIGLRYDITNNITVKSELAIFLPGFLRGTVALEFLF
jgi:hypothetical protein